MTSTTAQQIALDNALVALEKRVEIKKCNMRIDPTKNQKEPTYEVVLDALALTTCYPAFLITTDAPKIYMQQFWFTLKKNDSTTYKFKIDKKSYRIDMEVFREIFQICPRLPNKDFDELPSDDEIISFIKELGHKGDIKSFIEVFADLCTNHGEILIILGPMRFVSRSDDFQTYLAYATGEASPKIKRKIRKPASPSKKRTLVTEEEEEPDPAKKVVSSKKPATKRQKSERINEELYGDVDVSLTDAEPTEKEKDDDEMTIVGHMNVNQEGIGNQVKDDAQATQKTEGPIPSSSISSEYAAKYLNFDNIPLVDIKIVSMLYINVQHEVLHTLPLLTILVFVIPEHTIANPPKIVTTTSSITISSFLSSLFPHLQQLTPIPTPTMTEATTLTTVVSNSETLAALQLRVTDLEKDVKELKDIDNSKKVISTIQSEVLKAVKEYLGSSLDNAMHKVIQRNIANIIKEHSVPAETVERLSQQYAPQKSIKDI
nr:hypothetical protein [Tanacetum cinerariifolium]